MRRLSVLMRVALLLTAITVGLHIGGNTRKKTSQVEYIYPVSPIMQEGIYYASRTSSTSHYAKAPYNPTTCTWVGGTGNWNVPANWSCNQVPTSNNDVEVLIGSVTVNVNADAKTVKVGSMGSITVATGMTLVIHQ
jgi:hypothetical protein